MDLPNIVYPITSNAFKIVIYDLSKPKLRQEFKVKFEVQFIEVLQSAYGNSTYSRIAHLNRIYKEEQVVFLAFKKNAYDKITGCLCMKFNGKLSALAVRPECQDSGVGLQLIYNSTSLFPNQFIEIDPRNSKLKKLLRKVGYVPVISEASLRNYLQSDIIDLSIIEQNEDELVYKRRSTTFSQVEHIFTMYQFREA